MDHYEGAQVSTEGLEDRIDCLAMELAEAKERIAADGKLLERLIDLLAAGSAMAELVVAEYESVRLPAVVCDRSKRRR